MDNPFLDITNRLDQQDKRLDKILEFLPQLTFAMGMKDGLSHTDDENLNIKEVCKYLKKSKSTIIRYKNNGLLPYYKAGRTILFKKREVDKAMSCDIKAFKSK